MDARRIRITLGVWIGMILNVCATTPLVSLPLQGSLQDVAGNNAVSYDGSGSPSFVAGWNGPVYNDHQALDCTGSGSVVVQQTATTGEISISMWLRIDKFNGRSKVVLLDTGSQTGGVQLYFHSVNLNHGDAPNFYSNETANKSWIEFRVVGNSGGNGSTPESARSLFHRVNEWAKEFYENRVWWSMPAKEMNWVHVGVVYNPATKKVDFYKNERWDSTQTFSSAVSASINNIKVAPHQPINESLDGAIAQVNVFDQAIPRSEMERLGDFEQQIWAIKDIESWQDPSVTYYVSPTGSDSANGSAGSPVKTIAKGVSLLTGPGQRLVIKDGVYRITGSTAAGNNEQNLKNYAPTLNASGTRFKPIIIEAENPGNVILMGSEDWTGKSWTKSGTDTYYTAWPYDFSGYGNYNQNICYRPEGVIQNGVMFTPATSTPTQEGTFYVNNSQNRLYIRTKTPPANSSSLEVAVHRTSLLYMKEQDYVVVRGITFQHATNYTEEHYRSEAYGALEIAGAHGVLVEDCNFIQNIGHGLKLADHTAANYDGRAVIRRCSFYNNGYSPIVIENQIMNVLIEDCQIEAGGWRYMATAQQHPRRGDSSTIFKLMGTANIRFRRLQAVDTKLEVIWSDGMNMGHSLLDSYVGNVSFSGGFDLYRGHAWFDEISAHNVWWRGNSCYNIGCAYSHDGEGALIENCLFAGDTQQQGIVKFKAGTMYRRPGSSPFIKSENRFMNNTMYSSIGWNRFVDAYDTSEGWYTYVADGNRYARYDGSGVRMFRAVTPGMSFDSKRTVGGKTELTFSHNGKPEIQPGYFLKEGGETFTVESITFPDTVPQNPNNGIPYSKTGTILLNREDTGNKISGGITFGTSASYSNTDLTFSEWMTHCATNETNAKLLTSNPFANNSSVNVSFERDTLTVVEQQGPITIPVNLSQGVMDAMPTVELEVISGSATENVDFRVVQNATSSKVWKWLPLQRYHSVSLIIYPDALVEGNETFTLRLKNPTDCQLGRYSEMLVTIQKAGAPSAAIQVSSKEGVSPLTVVFDGSGSSDANGTIQSYAWDFDSDGSTDATGVRVTNVYAQGTYAARLTVTDNDNETSSDMVSITASLGNALPTIDFVEPLNGARVPENTDLYVKVNAADSDGSIANLKLYLDGQFIRQESNAPYEWGLASQNDQLLQNMSQGNYTLEVVATDNEGASATGSVTIVVSNGNVPPIASGTATPTSGIDPLMVVFDGSASSDSDGSIQSYEWDFDSDGSIDATGILATNIYNQGSHTAKLTVTDNDNLSNSTTLAITVTAGGGGGTNGTLNGQDAAQIDVGNADVAQSNTGLRSIKYGGTSYTRYIMARFDVSQLVGVDVTSATLNINVKHGDSGNQLPTSIFAYAVPDGNSGQSWTGGTSGITWNQVISTGLIPDLGVGLPGNYGQLIPVGQSPSVNYGDNGWTAISDTRIADQLDADTDGKITFLFAQEQGYNVSVRDPLTISLDYAAVGSGVNTVADKDSDGVSDFLEVAFGTDPGDATDTPDLLGDFMPKVDGSVGYNVRNMTDGYTYELQISTNLVSGSWQTENTFVGKGGPSVVTIDKSKASGDGQLYLRIKVSK